MIPERKTCKRCGLEKPAEEFSIKKKGNEQYLNPYCHECKRAIDREYYHGCMNDGIIIARQEDKFILNCF